MVQLDVPAHPGRHYATPTRSDAALEAGYDVAVAEAPPDGRGTEKRSAWKWFAAKTDRAVYVLEKPRVHIGRMAELTGAEQRVVRRNDVAFEEGGGEANSTVFRITCASPPKGWRLPDLRWGSEFALASSGMAVP